MAPAAGVSEKRTSKMAKKGGVHNREKHRGNNSRVHRRRNVTEEEKRQMRELYSEGLTGIQVAQKMGFGKTTVYNNLNIGRGSPTWNDDEIQILVDGYAAKKPV